MSDRPRLPPFFSLVALDRIDSTNAEALRWARAGAPEGTIVWALEQTGGRGRRWRVWSSPPGNLYASILLRPAVRPAQAAQLGFVAAVAIAEALRLVLPMERQVRCKWPNDLLIDGAKVAGILPEAEAAGRNVEALVLGIGINLMCHPADTPYPATSLRAAGSEIAIGALLESLAGCLHLWYRSWQDEGFAPIRARWLEFATGLGQAVEVRLEGATLQGRFAALDASGALDLELADGGHRLVTAGDVFYPAA
jgi:BirA family biotin operon repressor/biotin-[acetyl-CoA-carboxylase] ligase